MNKTDLELFDSIMESWLSYKITSQAIAEAVYSETSPSDVNKWIEPDGPLSDHDQLGRKVQRLRRLKIKPEEWEALDIIRRLRDNKKFVTIEAVVKRRTRPDEKLPTQKIIAAICGVSLDVYKKRRAKAKALVVLYSGSYQETIARCYGKKKTEAVKK